MSTDRIKHQSDIKPTAAKAGGGLWEGGSYNDDVKVSEVIGIPAQSSRTGRVVKKSKVLLQNVEGRARALVQPLAASGGNAVSKEARGVLPSKRVAGRNEGERDAFSPRKAIRVFKCGPHERNDRVTSFRSLILDLERLGIVELSHVSQVAAYCNSAAFKFWL